MSEQNTETDDKPSTAWALIAIGLGVASVFTMFAQPALGMVVFVPLAIYFGLYMNDTAKTHANRKVAEGAFTCMAIALTFEPVRRAEPLMIVLLFLSLAAVLLWRHRLPAWREMAILVGIGLAAAGLNVQERSDSHNLENRQTLHGCITDVLHQSRGPGSFTITDTTGSNLRIWRSKFELDESSPVRVGECGEMQVYRSGERLKLFNLVVEEQHQKTSTSESQM